jgi:hypothetical protein
MEFSDLKHKETLIEVLSSNYGNPVSIGVIKNYFERDPKMENQIRRLDEIIGRLFEMGKSKHEVVNLLGNVQQSV